MSKALLCALLLLLGCAGIRAETLHVEGGLHLIPEPRSISHAQGMPFILSDSTRVYTPPLERPELLATQALLDAIEERWGRRPVLDRVGLAPIPDDQQRIEFRIADAASTSEAYRLDVNERRILLAAESPIGLLHGIRTLRQLVAQPSSMPVIHAVTIEDAPAFRHRGFYHDVSRGKVPTLATLKRIVDKLDAYKVNQFQLYIEHPFAFRFNPAIAQGDALTPEEILELQEYCRDRRIDLVPSLQSFGHMAGVLSLPEYRELADVELTKPWDQLDWVERQNGATINPRDPRALALLEQMHDAYVPLHDSPFINVCADETYDLGKGKTLAIAEQIGKGRLYLSHIEWLNGLAKRHGKRMMFWGDIVKQHPELIPEIPRDAILLNWGYMATTDFESSRLFAEAGLEFYVCPGTNGWLRFTNDIETAELNIRRFAAAGKKYGATGLLNTDWGDRGHVNMLSGSWHGLAMGAAMAWNPDAPNSSDFDARWDAMTFGHSGGGAKALRAQSTGLYPWLTFVAPFDDMDLVAKWKFTEEQAQRHAEGAALGIRTFTQMQKVGAGDELDVAELLHGSRMNALGAEKLLLMFELQRQEGKPDAKLRRRFRDFAKELSDTAPAYRELWLARNKPSDLERLMAALDRTQREALRWSRTK